MVINNCNQALKHYLGTIYPNGYTLGIFINAVAVKLGLSSTTVRRLLNTELVNIASLEVRFLLAVYEETGCSLYMYANQYANVDFSQMAAGILKV